MLVYFCFFVEKSHYIVVATTKIGMNVEDEEYIYLLNNKYQYSSFFVLRHLSKFFIANFWVIRAKRRCLGICHHYICIKWHVLNINKQKKISKLKIPKSKIQKSSLPRISNQLNNRYHISDLNIHFMYHSYFNSMK
jgi:hypothetical protein